MYFCYNERCYSRNTINFPSRDLNATMQVLRKIPGPLSLPVIGAQWMYMRFIGKYSYDKYHEANEEKLRLFGPVVREDVIWKYPLIHLFDSEVTLT